MAELPGAVAPMSALEHQHPGVGTEMCQRTVHEESHGTFPGFNRARSAVIEAAILVSRLHMLPIDKIDAELAYLQIAIDKTAGPAELEAWGWLIERIAAHRAGAQA